MHRLYSFDFLAASVEILSLNQIRHLSHLKHAESCNARGYPGQISQTSYFNHKSIIKELRKATRGPTRAAEGANETAKRAVRTGPLAFPDKRSSKQFNWSSAHEGLSSGFTLRPIARHSAG